MNGAWFFFLSCNLWYRVSVLPMLWGIVMFLSKLGLASNISSFAFLMPWNISENSFNMKYFASVTFFGTSSFSSQPFSTFISVGLYWVPLVCIASLFIATVSTFPRSTVTSIALFTFDSNSASRVITFSCLAVLSSSWPNPSWLDFCHVSLSLEDTEATKLHAFSFWINWITCAVTMPTNFGQRILK